MSGLSGAVREPGAALLWEEGMALAPQHFQQMALRQEQLLAYQMTALTPYPWGVVRLQFDVDVLPEGLVRVRELECVLPDGLVVMRLQDRDPPLEIDVRPYQEAAGRGPITVHLTVPAGRSITGAGGELARFDVAETPDVGDDAGGALPVTVRRLAPRLGLEITTAPRQRPPAKFFAMPLLRLAHDGRVFRQADFAPPSLIVGDRSALWRMLQDLCRRAREKAHHLARQPSAQGKSGEPSSLARLELGGIASGLPSLEALLGSGRSHPFTLYVELCRYLGLISTLASGEVPPAPPRYDHDDPLAAFSEVIAAIERALAHSQRNLVSVYFTAEGSKFTLQLEPAWSRGRMLVGLRPKPAQKPADLVTWFERALVATQDRSQELWNLRVRGAIRRQIDAASETDLVAPADTLVFAVDFDSAYISEGETLEIWNTDNRSEDQRPAEIILFVKG
jgi:type VI secretion system protein ImpJ